MPIPPPEAPPARGRASGRDRREIVAIFLGGCLGSLARTGVGRLGLDDGHWPWGTLLINLGGALLLGYLVTRLQERLPVSRYRRPLLGTGFCGALTTFSTLQVQLLEMLDHGRYAIACAYALASVLGGLLGVLLASALVRRVRVVR